VTLQREIEQRIYRLCGVCTGLVVASFIVPRFVSGSEAWFAGLFPSVVLAMMVFGLFGFLSY